MGRENITVPIDLTNKKTRRDLLGTALRAAAIGGAAEMLSPLKLGAAVPGGRAAVCIFLIGGSDSNNMIVPLDLARFSTYTAGRGELALPKSTLLPVNSARQQGLFGFHPQLGELAGLYNRGWLAVLANVGPLVAPLTKAQAVANAGLPAGLYVHTSALNMSYLRPGIVVDPWTSTLQPADPKSTSPQVFNLGGVTMTSSTRLNLPGPTAENPTIAARVASASLRTVFPNSYIGAQLLRVAKLLKVSSALGVQRPVFSCVMSGWDTHSNELSTQATLFNDLSKAMNAFLLATQELGMADQVVTYTKTEFNRTLRPNTTQGTEHAWGGHELIMGSSVRGGDIYGTFPSLALGGPDDLGVNGIWIPTTADDQYAATVADWYGLGQGQLLTALPGVRAFQPANLGFL
jgi:uncharacterized protein (DUF1501 family)